ncbi:MAG TPA: peptidase, partial [Thermoanaerobaculia bacterium]|nr:peptidase [Thermoanaerobaculia bacterium]
EMLMELAYRLAVSERPEIDRIRKNVVVLITPIAEPDGRDRVVQWYYRHLRDRDLPYEELEQFDSPPYWGHYVFHDNNRDGMQLTQNLTLAINEAWWRHHAQIFHDLHESLPLLYISTGHGPYSKAIDPVTINEWTQFAHHEAGALQAKGLPGVWTWGFWDGWWPGYLFSVANNHNATGRFYETFGNTMAGTFDRDLEDVKFVGKPVTEVQWYRPWPPDKKVRWSLRNNTNYMQAGVLEALQYASRHGEDLLENFWIKGVRALEKGRTEPPYAFAFSDDQRDLEAWVYLINQLRRHHIEVHKLDDDFLLGDVRYDEGSYVIRLDQPYRNAALNFLERQKFPAEEPNPPYDDVAWTWPLLFGVEGIRVEDKAFLDAPMTLVEEVVRPRGKVRGAGDVFLISDTGQNALMRVRLELGRQRVEVAEEPFVMEEQNWPAGTWILRGSREQAEQLADQHGLWIKAVPDVPDVPRHEIDVPRIAVLHTWSTQDTGWVRYLFDRERIPYTLINPDHLKKNDLSRFQVILLPNQWGNFARMVHGIDPKYGPLAYTRTDRFPSHGAPDASEDITGGMGLVGLLNLQRWIHNGGLLITLANAGTLVVDGGLVRDARRASGSFSTPGSELTAKVVNPRHPVTYGYENITSVFRGNGPLFDVPDRLKDRVVLQFGTKQKEEEEEGKKESDSAREAAETTADQEEQADVMMAAPPAASQNDAKEEKPADLVLSGFVRGKEEVDGKPAILDLPVGKGRVLLFNFNALHRYLNHSDFRFVYNALLNWNDL